MRYTTQYIHHNNFSSLGDYLQIVLEGEYRVNSFRLNIINNQHLLKSVIEKHFPDFFYGDDYKNINLCLGVVGNLKKDSPKNYKISKRFLFLLHRSKIEPDQSHMTNINLTKFLELCSMDGGPLRYNRFVNIPDIFPQVIF